MLKYAATWARSGGTIYRAVYPLIVPEISVVRVVISSL